MSYQDVGEKISGKLDRARSKLEAKLEAAQARKSELQPQFEVLEKDLSQLEAELEAVSTSEDPVQHARLEVRRERLLAKRERLQLRQEVLDSKIEGYREGVEQLQKQWSQIPGLSRAKPTRQPTRDLEAERRRILDMVAEGKITAEDASRLLEAMSGQAERQPSQPTSRPSVVRVRVTDLEADKVRVNIKLPLSLIRTALRKGRDVKPDIDIGGLRFDASELEELLRTGVHGHIIDIEEGRERVEVLVE
jgi:polyhydroxyalkanoate synthesis regulator phasin